MSDVAEALYPNGPSKALGNESMSKIFDVPLTKEHYDDHKKLHQAIQEFIKKNNLKENDIMRMKFPPNDPWHDEVEHYKYLGPDAHKTWDFNYLKLDNSGPTS